MPQSTSTKHNNKRKEILWNLSAPTIPFPEQAFNACLLNKLKDENKCRDNKNRS
jgi:hypothetical protein